MIAGREWDDWLRILEKEEAATCDHAAIAKLVLPHVPASVENPEWWAQRITVDFEKHIGRRVTGQSCDGDFTASASKTISGDMDSALEKWEEFAAAGLAPAHVIDGPTVSRTEKWRYWRVQVADPQGQRSKVDVLFNNKTPDKATVAINHTKLATEQDRDMWKAEWRRLLAAFAATL